MLLSLTAKETFEWTILLGLRSRTLTIKASKFRDRMNACKTEKKKKKKN